MGKKKKNLRFRANQRMPTPYEERPIGTQVKYTSTELWDYYTAQGWLTEDEWKTIFETYQKPLPATMRISQIEPDIAQLLRGRMQNKWTQVLKEAAKEQIDSGEVIPEEQNITPPTPLPWYPDDMAWKIDLPRRFIRKSPLLKQFHTSIMYHNIKGNLTRQETVSMVPVMFLPVKSDSYLLDMCAAPGSKTTQMLERLRVASVQENKPVTGLVLANDVNFNRCEVLVTQTGRMKSMLPHLILTNHDARSLPLMRQDNGKPLQFDAILADVMCTGDGTLRKAPDLWKKWGPQMGCQLHKLQIAVLMRAMHLVKEGGTIVYSTCSLNPVEDEAVVLYCLRTIRHQMEIMDVSDHLPGLKRSPGEYRWVVKPKAKGPVYKSYDEIPDIQKQSYPPSLFPDAVPGPSPEELKLERCMRFYPHLQDTGGFFVAVIRKVKQMGRNKTRPDAPGGVEDECGADDDIVEGVVPVVDIPVPEDGGPGGVYEDTEGTPMVEGGEGDAVVIPEEAGGEDTAETPMNEGDTAATSTTTGKEGEETTPMSKREQRTQLQTSKVTDFLVPLPMEFRDRIVDQIQFRDGFDATLLHQRESTDRRVLIVAPAVRDLLAKMIASRHWRIVGAGTRILEGIHLKSESGFRFTQDGVSVVAPFLSPRHIIDVTVDDFVKLLKTAARCTIFDDFSEPVKRALAAEETSNVAAFIARLADPTEDGAGPMYLSCWKLFHDCKVMTFASKDVVKSFADHLGVTPPDLPPLHVSEEVLPPQPVDGADVAEPPEKRIKMDDA